jgi:hypothetical protein
MSMRAHCWVLFHVLWLCPVLASAQAGSQNGGNFCTPSPPSPEVIFRVPCIDDAHRTWEDFNARSPVRFGAGAYHFWNVNRKTGEETYGFPGLPGTYYYYLTVDADHRTSPEARPGIGMHTQVRWRDASKFRSFFSSRLWLYEFYGFLDTPAGVLKAGKIRNRIGLDWDSSFFGNVPYLDGFKLDPDWGVSVESAWPVSDRLNVESFAQFFFAEDNVNGSFPGGDAESESRFDEKNTFVGRVAPRYRIAEDFDLYGGLSGFVGSIDDRRRVPEADDETVTGFAVDLGIEKSGFNLFGEVLWSHGTRNPTHYVTGGPSDESFYLTLGATYLWGPTLLRSHYSRGEYEAPGGDQDAFIVGVDVNLTAYITLTFEYVKWKFRPDDGPSFELEDGFQFALLWHI